MTRARSCRFELRLRRGSDATGRSGAVSALRRFQDEVNEVRAGMDCGIRIDGFNDFQIGDMIEAYTVEKIAAKL